jgi:hypothetical protein
MTVTVKNRIMILGPKNDGTYVVEFRIAEGEALAISIPRSEAHVIWHFQERMPYGLFVPEVPSDQAKPHASRTASAKCGRAVALDFGSNLHKTGVCGPWRGTEIVSHCGMVAAAGCVSLA